MQRWVGQCSYCLENREIAQERQQAARQNDFLALQAAAYTEVDAYPLDVLGAETEGMIGYLLEQEMANLLPSRTVTTLLTRVEVDPADPAFAKPTKPIGPVYTQDQSTRIAAEKHWAIAPDGDSFRRVVASPQPIRVPGLDPIRWLLERGALGMPLAAAVSRLFAAPMGIACKASRR